MHNLFFFSQKKIRACRDNSSSFHTIRPEKYGFDITTVLAGSEHLSQSSGFARRAQTAVTSVSLVRCYQVINGPLVASRRVDRWPPLTWATRVRAGGTRSSVFSFFPIRLMQIENPSSAPCDFSSGGMCVPRRAARLRASVTSNPGAEEDDSCHGTVKLAFLPPHFRLIASREDDVSFDPPCAPSLSTCPTSTVILLQCGCR